MWGIVAIAFGIGALIGLIYVTIRYIIPLIAFIAVSFVEEVVAWARWFKQLSNKNP